MQANAIAKCLVCAVCSATRVGPAKVDTHCLRLLLYLKDGRRLAGTANFEHLEFQVEVLALDDRREQIYRIEQYMGCAYSKLLHWYRGNMCSCRACKSWPEGGRIGQLVVEKHWRSMPHINELRSYGRLSSLKAI